MDPQGRDLERLRFDVSRGLLVSGMQASQGWKLLEEELHKMLEAYKAKAVDPKIIGQPYEHATLVGAHNAIRSLLDLLEITKERGQVSKKKLDEAESAKREEDAAERKLSRL